MTDEQLSILRSRGTRELAVAAVVGLLGVKDAMRLMRKSQAAQIAAVHEAISATETPKAAPVAHPTELSKLRGRALWNAVRERRCASFAQSESPESRDLPDD